MRTIRRGDTGPAVAEIRAVLTAISLLPAVGSATTGTPTAGTPTAGTELDEFDEATEQAVRAFQQSRGLTADGRVTEETWRALDAARWRLGARTLYQAIPEPLVGEDVRTLQERLLEMGYDVGRAEGSYGPATARAVAQFQREVGLQPDGTCGPRTLHALRRLGRKVVGGRPQWLREAELLRRAGPALVGKRVVVDPGHGGDDDPGVTATDGPLQWTEADLAYDLATRLEGRLAATGVRVHLTRGPRPAAPLPDPARAQLANELHADLFVSIHLDGHPNPAAEGVATYHYGTTNGVTSTVGERLAGLVLREIVARTGQRDCRTHARTWELLRLTRMPAVQVEVGYLTSPAERRRLIEPRFRDIVVDAIVAAVQRMYYPVESDVPTGSIDVSSLRRPGTG